MDSVGYAPISEMWRRLDAYGTTVRLRGALPLVVPSVRTRRGGPFQPPSGGLPCVSVGCGLDCAQVAHDRLYAPLLEGAMLTRLQAFAIDPESAEQISTSVAWSCGVSFVGRGQTPTEPCKSWDADVGTPRNSRSQVRRPRVPGGDTLNGFELSRPSRRHRSNLGFGRLMNHGCPGVGPKPRPRPRITPMPPELGWRDTVRDSARVVDNTLP